MLERLQSLKENIEDDVLLIVDRLYVRIVDKVLKTLIEVGFIRAQIANQVRTRTHLYKRQFEESKKAQNILFREYLKGFCEEFGIDENSEVLYIGSCNDESVKEVLPQTKHIDIEIPDNLPENFNLIKGDVTSLPIKDSIADLMVLRNLDHKAMESGDTAKELARMLKDGGKVFMRGYYLNTEEDQTEETYRDLKEKCRNLRILINFLENGFTLLSTNSECFSYFEKTNKVEKEEIKKLKRMLAENLQLFEDRK